MATKIIEKRRTARISRVATLPRNHEAVGDILRETAGLWRGKKLDPLAVRIPASWYKAAGMLRHKRHALELHLKRIRREWDRRS